MKKLIDFREFGAALERVQTLQAEHGKNYEREINNQ